MAGPTPNSVLAAGSQPWVQSACDWEAERWQGCPVQPDLWGICGAREPCAAGMFGGSSLQTRPTSLACVALSPVGGAPLERSPGISSLLCDLNGTRPFAMGHFLVVVVFTYGDFSTLMHRFLVFAA